MNNKGQANVVFILIIIAIVVFTVFYIFKGEILPTREGEMINGYWNEATQECWPDSSTPIDQPFTAGFDETLYQCCFNAQKQQVDCNDPSKLLESFAVYQGNAGLFYVAHGIKLKNTGNVEITRAWIDSASWSPTHAGLSNAYSGIVGSIHGKGPLCLSTGCDEVAWSTGQIDLQAIGGSVGSPKTYSLALVTKGSAEGLADFSKVTPATITVEKEDIGFSVVINLGA